MWTDPAARAKGSAPDLARAGSGLGPGRPSRASLRLSAARAAAAVASLARAALSAPDLVRAHRDPSAEPIRAALLLELAAGAGLSARRTLDLAAELGVDLSAAVGARRGFATGLSLDLGPTADLGARRGLSAPVTLDLAHGAALGARRGFAPSLDAAFSLGVELGVIAGATELAAAFSLSLELLAAVGARRGMAAGFSLGAVPSAGLGARRGVAGGLALDAAFSAAAGARRSVGAPLSLAAGLGGALAARRGMVSSPSLDLAAAASLTARRSAAAAVDLSLAAGAALGARRGVSAGLSLGSALAAALTVVPDGGGGGVSWTATPSLEFDPEQGITESAGDISEWAPIEGATALTPDDANEPALSSADADFGGEASVDFGAAAALNGGNFGTSAAAGCVAVVFDGGGTRAVCAIYEGNNDRQFRIYRTNNGAVHLNWHDAGDTNQTISSAGGATSAGTPYVIAYRLTDGAQGFWLDGVSVGTDTASYDNGEDGEFSLGGYTGTTGALDGRIGRNAHWFGTVPSAAEMVTNSAALAGYYGW